MALPQNSTLLERVQEKFNIDVDTLDTDFIRSLPIIPTDQTSNPAWLFVQLQHPSTKELATQIIQSDPGLQSDGDALVLLSKLAVAFCKRNIPFIKGRVLVQTSPSGSYSTQAVLDHARIYAREFERAGISKDRYCIKIMSTGPGLNAAKILHEEGIPILGTGVFSLEQALACFQARVLYISPYYNGIKELRDPSLYTLYEDPALQHPFTVRMVQMVQAYKDLYHQTGQQPPLIKNAGFGSFQEVLASAEIGCHSATISIVNAQELLKPELAQTNLPQLPTKLDNLRYPYAAHVPIPSARLQGISSTAQAATTNSEKLVSLTADYLGEGGDVLDKIVAADEIAKTRLEEALALFRMAEEGSLEIVKSLLKAAGNPSSVL